MAKKFTNTGSINDIATGATIQAGHVQQSVLAFRGEEEYDIIISGSLAVTGSLFNKEMSTDSGASGFGTVVVNPTTGQFLYTGSYGGAGGASNTSGTSGTSGEDGTSGTSGTSGLSVDVKDGTTTVTGVDIIDFTSGATVTANGTTAEVAISGGGGGSTKYAFLVTYVGESLSNTDGDIVQQTSSPYSNNSVTINHAVSSAVTFLFSSETHPPSSVIIYAYNASNIRYEVATAPYNTDSLIKNTANSFNTTGTDVTSDLLSAASTMKLDLDYGDIGGSTGLSGKNGHAYVIFNF